MECRLRATPEQFMILLKFMETHGDLGRPHPGLPGRIKSERHWQQLGKMLNSSPGGVVKSLDKWKKVWADWKAKTKKKALRIRREAPTGRSGTRLTLTAPEKRVLGVMGIKAALVLKTVKIEKESDEEPSNRDPLSPNTTDPGQSEFPSYSVKNEVELNFVPVYSMEKSSTATPPPSSEQSIHQTHVPTPPPAPVSRPMPPLNDTTSQGMSRRWRPVTRLPEGSSAETTLRRLRLFRARTQREKTSFQRSANEFASIEAARLRLEVEREKNNHRKEMERLRIESRRIEMEENRNNTLNHMVIVLDKLTEILPQLRTALRSTIAVPIENYST